MERQYNDRQDTIRQYTFNDYPKELQKKITLIQHFRNYLEGDSLSKVKFFIKDASQFEE